MIHRPHNTRPCLIRRVPERSLSFSLLILCLALSCLTMAAAILTIPPPAFAADASPEQEMQSRLQTLRDQARTMAVDLAAGRSISDSQYQTFVAVIGQIKTAHQTLAEQFDLRADTVRSLGGMAVDRQAVMLAAYQRIVPALLSLTAPVTDIKALTPALINQILSLLSEVIAPPEPLILGSLPVLSPGYSPGEPAVSPAVVPAYQGGDQTVTEADTAATPEAPVTRQIAELAQSLDWNPVLMYEYVKNNITTEFYHGLMKGASQTLAQKSGNDADQAALIVALFRAAGYPARYVTGAIEFFPGLDQAKEHFGVQDPDLIAVLLQKAGIPYQKIIKAGRLANYWIEHVWAEVYIPYGPSRGADPRDPEQKWIPVDTAVKPEGHTVSEPVACDLSPAQAGDDYLAAYHADCFLDFLSGAVESWLEAAGQPEAAFSDTLLTRTAKPEQLNILSPALQFTTAAVTGEYTQLPDRLIHKVRFIAKTDAVDLFDVTLDTFALSNQPITLSFEPETVEDQEIINSFGGLDHTPCYLVRLRPVIKVAGVNQAVGADGLAMGRPFELTAEFISPAGTHSVTNTRVCGSLASIGLVAGDAVMPGAVAPEEMDAARLMHEMAVSYIDMWNQAEADLAGYLGVTAVHPLPSLVTVGGVVNIDYLLSDPHVFTWQGLYLDADLRAVGAVPAAEDYPSDNALTLLGLTGLAGSDLEARIFEETINIDSISTAELFMLAGQGGIPVLEIDDANIDTVLPTLSLADNIRTDIQNAVNQGQIVRIPQTPISTADWTGIGYVKADPVTGASGWMLSGAIAGAMTVLNPDHISWDAFKQLKMPYTKPPTDDPGAAAYIRYIPINLDKRHVAETIDLTVVVSDAWFRPVPGVEVSFEAVKGGGSFPEGNVALTEYDGRATIRFTLGEHTADNKTFVWDQTQAEATQVGVNLIDARVQGTAAYLTSTITIQAWPLEADHLTVRHGKSEYYSIRLWAGFISVTAEDIHNNPVSNVDVTFTAGDIVSSCLDYVLSDKPMKFFDNNAACFRDGYADYNECGQTGSLTDTTNAEGFALTHVIMGSVPSAKYYVAASAENLDPVDFIINTYSVGDCNPNTPPGTEFVCSMVRVSNHFGQPIEAGAPDAVLPISTSMHLILEVPEYEGGSGEDEEPVFIGSNYVVVNDFDTSTVTVSGPGGTCNCVNAGHVYNCDYTLAPGINTLTVDFQGTYQGESYSNTMIGATVYGITADFVDDLGAPINEVFVPVNEDYLSIADTILNVAVVPAAYIPANSYVIIYANDVPASYIPIDIVNGQDTAELARGSYFDETKTYTAAILLNNGGEEPLEMETPADERLKLTPFNIDITGRLPGTMAEPGAEVLEVFENESANLMAAVNDDNDDNDVMATDDEFILLVDNDDTVINAMDRDIVKFTLGIKPKLPVGTLTLSTAAGSDIRIFNAQGTAELADWSVNLASPDPQNDLYGLATNGAIDLYAEGLQANRDVVLTLTYNDAKGVKLCSDELHLAIVGFKVYSDNEAGPDKPHRINVNTGRRHEVDHYKPYTKCVSHVWDGQPLNLAQYIEGYDENPKFFEENLKWGVSETKGGNVTWQSSYGLRVGKISPKQNCMEDYYIVVAQNGGNSLDYLILTVVPQPTLDDYNSWYQIESGDRGWLGELYDIYNRIEFDENHHPFDPEAGCSYIPPFGIDVWGTPDDIDSFYHAGGFFEMRSQATAGKHSAQAIYNRSGELIKEGASAGSADRQAPPPSQLNLKHVGADVNPFVWAAQLDGNAVEGSGRTMTELIFHQGKHLNGYFVCRPPIAPNQGLLTPGECQPEN